MAKKYLKNSKGIVRATTTDTLQLEKPLLNENYDIEVHNRNMDKLDEAIQGLKGKIDNVGDIVEELELKAEKVSIADAGDYFTSNNVEGALNELAVEVHGQRLRGISIANSMIDKLEGWEL